MTSLVLRHARIVGDGRLTDIVSADGRVAAIGRALDAPAGAEELDLDGRWLMPGLWDAHVHFTQWARHRGRVDLAGARSAADAAATLLSHVTNAGAAPVVGRGFQDALWPDAPSAEHLAAAGTPVVAISHDLHSVWLNSAAATMLAAPHAGLLREADAFAAELALDRATGDVEELVTAAAIAAAARGLVGIRDLELADNVARWRSRVELGHALFRVEACIYQEHLAASDARGLVGGSVVPGTGGLVSVGGLKIFTDGALNTRTALTHEPYGAADGDHSVGHAAHSETELRDLFGAATERNLEVAAHAIGDLAVTGALDAFEATGARGTIEHAQLVRGQDLPRFARLGVAASVQPQHAIDDREVTDVVWADRAARAFPYRSLADAGATLLLGSDAPVAPLDPWVTFAAAVSRTDDDRGAWHPEQEVTREVAIAASVRSSVAVGEAADLIAVDYDPLTAKPTILRAMPVALTLLGGRVTHAALT
ncbi:amidohydrolase [Demequina sp.]|uniref:amidohydrolase n=1 Tax=Demequina sp. TaxID=2050685 RepID=UPI003D0D1DBE